MAEYTSGGDKLHMCYTFDMLGPEFTAEHFRTRDRAVLRRRAERLAVLELLQPRRRPPHHALGQARARSPRALGAAGRRRCCSSLSGSVCIYQGEELGLPETDILFEELTDPPRHPLLARVQGPRRLPHADALGRGRGAQRLHHRQALAAGQADRSRRSTSRARTPTRTRLLSFYRKVLAFRRAARGADRWRHRVLQDRRARARLPPHRRRARASSASSIFRPIPVSRHRSTANAGVADRLEGAAVARIALDARRQRLRLSSPRRRQARLGRQVQPPREGKPRLKTNSPAKDRRTASTPSGRT